MALIFSTVVILAASLYLREDMDVLLTRAARWVDLF